MNPIAKMLHDLSIAFGYKTERYQEQRTDYRIGVYEIHQLFIDATDNLSLELRDSHLTDKSYKLVDIDHMKGYLRSNPVSSRVYVPNKHDCDDFSFILQGDVTRWDSDLAFGIIHGRRPGKDGHAWNWCVGTDKEIWFIEPQDDTLWKPESLWEIWLVLM